MRSANIKNLRQEHPARFGLFLLVFLLNGCSTWSWKGGSQDGERLTRVIHAENARLKDLVVQLRSSNEDMAQRALDDSARIARLEEENEGLTTSVAAYQSERERMAKAFQNLQQQVQVALTDRGVVATSTRQAVPPPTSQSLDDSSQATPPPEGQYNMEKRQLVLKLDPWFAGDSTIIAKDQEARLARLAGWIEQRASSRSPDHPIVAGFIGPRHDQLTRVSLPASPPLPETAEGRPDRGEPDLDQTRAKRLWEAVSLKIRADLAAQIQFEGKSKTGVAEGSDPSGPAIVVQF